MISEVRDHSTVRAEVKGFRSADLDSGRSEDPTDVHVAIELDVGPADEPGEEQFQIVVISPTALAREVDNSPILIGRHYLIVRELDLPAIRRFLKDRIEAMESDTWPELAARIGRLGLWEFEDYRE